MLHFGVEKAELKDEKIKQIKGKKEKKAKKDLKSLLEILNKRDAYLKGYKLEEYMVMLERHGQVTNQKQPIGYGTGENNLEIYQLSKLRDDIKKLSSSIKTSPYDFDCNIS